MTEDLNLNESQEAVVNAGSEPILVVAGPGAGKTTILRERIRHLFSTSDKFTRVLAVTFTNVAAANLRDKLKTLDGNDAQRVDVGTFHALSARLLQQHGSHIGLPSDFSIVTEDADRAELLRLAYINAGLVASDRNILPLISRLLERAPSASEVGQYVDDARLDADEVTTAFEAYVQICTETGQLDFALLVYLANSLLAKVPAIAKQVRRTYAYICVDEFQDTNDAQFRLLGALCVSSNAGLLLLADQDQVIFQWNGASPLRLAEARDTFGMEVMVLPTSFRCPSNILSAANKLIAHNEGRFVSPVLNSAVTTDGSIAVQKHVSEAAEAQWLAEALLAIPAADIPRTAVLARSRRLVGLCFNESKRRGVQCVMPVSRSEFASAPMQMLHSILRLANRPDVQRRVEQLTSAYFNVTGQILDPKILLAEGLADETSALERFLLATEQIAPASSEYAVLVSIVRNKMISRKEFRGVSRALLAWIDALPDSQQKATFASDFAEERIVWDHIELAHQGLASEGVSLGEFLRKVDLESKFFVDPNQIRFVTVHGAKGLEFDNIFLVGAAEDEFPSFQAIKAGQASQAMQEERRSFFVAVTRCKRNLCLSFATKYSGWQKVRSRFISEMGLP